MGTFALWLSAFILAVLIGMAIFYAVLPHVIRPLLRVLLWPRYRIIVRGLENVPREGPVLFAANHASWFDGFYLASTAPRRGKALVSADIIDRPVIRWFAIRSGMIPTPFQGSKAIRGAIDATRKVLENRDAIGIFPEGQISRNGLVGPFFRGLEVMIKGTPDAKVIPVAIDNVWGSLLSYSGGRFFKKRPVGLRRTINIVYGEPLSQPITAFEVRQELLVALAKAHAMRPKPRTLPETIDLTLPHWSDPKLGLLTASAQDIILPGIRQPGHEEGTVGLPVPGAAIRAVDSEGKVLPPDTNGHLEAFTSDHREWNKTGKRGRIRLDGFVAFEEVPINSTPG